MIQIKKQSGEVTIIEIDISKMTITEKVIVISIGAFMILSLIF